MKVLFVIHDLGFADHIAIAHLSAIAKQLGHQTYFCTLDRNDAGAIVKEISPNVIAYSVNIIGYRNTLEAHREAQKIHAFVSIMGGPQPTFSPETFAESGMDAYCVGEGDLVFRDFLVSVEKGSSYDKIENLITRNGENPLRPLISNLDDLPPSDRDLVISHSFLRNAAKKTFYATRGCPFNCTYCFNNYYRQLYKGKGPPIRRFSVERLMREIEDIKRKYRMDFLKFGDDCFTIKADAWLEEFAEKYRRRIGIPFNCYLRIDTVNDAILALLKNAGCYSVHLSVDSTSKHLRDVVLGRKMQSENIVERLRKIREHGINTFVNYMLAVPESTLEDDFNTIKQSKEAKVTYPSYTTTVPIEKTELWGYCVKRGLIDPATYRGDMSGCMERSALSCFTEKEKDIRYNIFLLGALTSKLPFPLDRLAKLVMKVFPPNRLFRKINQLVHYYYIENKIFKLTKDNLRTPRFWKAESKTQRG